MIITVIGTISFNFLLACSSNSNCPENATLVPGLSFTFSLMAVLISFTTDTMSLPRAST
ncbi:Uncharacterised protein [Klebsiella pneumoniae]|uniref:Uncharacterized protein n=1 Tax=Klebsiella pneumoniae TaxID=573 RepID=A0A486S5R0_KLEPN|nr:Uncharacterised protein [Serratia marcescens]SLR71006.1 Uncharacterised protein [Klebsiella pneumoniae]SLS04217.1 Uncharacterised protein [Klebsiella pneumoniae]SLS84839.1 Uncharacterised protein [Klebsiella pneumoniae]SLV76286.1 Uncharacterised protein [Klebsiella pneumoniae]